MIVDRPMTANAARGLVIHTDKKAAEFVQVPQEKNVNVIPAGDNWLARLHKNLNPDFEKQFEMLNLGDDEETKCAEEPQVQKAEMSRLEQDVRARLRETGTGKLLRQVRELVC